jgi:hypothetical protein
MALSLSQFVRNSDNWATGGKPGIGSQIFTDPKKPFQPGWDSIGELDPNTHGTNKPTIQGNYRVVWMYNVREVKNEGKNWHKNLDSMYCFIVNNEKKKAALNLAAELKKSWYEDTYTKKPARLPGIGSLQDIRSLPAVNYSLMVDCKKKTGRPLSVMDLRHAYIPLAPSHTEQNTADAYPVGSHVTNFTIAGEIDCFNIWNTSDYHVRETDSLYLLLVPVPTRDMKNKIFCFNPEGDDCVPSPEMPEDSPHQDYVWQIKPWVSQTGNGPSFEDYEISLEGGGVVRGTFWYVGMVKEIVFAESNRKPVEVMNYLSKRMKGVDCTTSVQTTRMQPIIRILVNPFALPGV